MSLEFRLVGLVDSAELAEILQAIDPTFPRPHPFTVDEAWGTANHAGHDVNALLVEDGRPIAYGMLRGWDEGYGVPSLGIAIRTGAQGRGLGRVMMEHLHAEAGRRGATAVRLRVHTDNVRARRLYESMGYAYEGEERGELVMLVALEQRATPPRTVNAAPSALTGTLLEVAAPEWESTLRTAHHDFYHLPSYVALCAARERARPCALYVSDGRRTMLLPLMIRSIPGGGFDAASPYGYPGPIGIGTDDPDFLRDTLVAGLAVLRDAGLVSAFIRLHPLLNVAPPAGVGTLVRHGDTVSVDLALTSGELWAQTRNNHRRDISKTIRLGYEAHMDKEWRHVESFKRLYRQTMERNSATPFYFFGDGYFEGLRDALGERLHLCVVEKSGVVAAAGLFVETNGIVQYHLAGTGETLREAQPAKLMTHFTIAWAKERGNRVLHLGGGVGGATDSLLQYKSGFSPLRHTFATLRVVLDEVEYVRLVAALGTDFDPDDREGFFPPYRIREESPGDDPGEA